MDNLVDDPSFIDAIVHEVKSQGLFDQFRKECLADVDTKPAYQNLRQRVETSVSKFLSQQKWSDNIRHKNQLRERLRRNIIESGFLETGVERIVDQVVNPKISTVFHPKVEEIVYNYLGIEKPEPVINGGVLDAQTDFLPEDLEAVSPDSDKKSSSASSDVPNTVEHTINEDMNEFKEHVDDFESPAFEPLETRPPSQTKQESNDSHASAISGLTSQESVESEHINATSAPSVTKDDGLDQVETARIEIGGHGIEVSFINEDVSHIATTSPEIAQNDSQLSQVSSNSRLSIITTSEGNQKQPIPNPGLDITEEAQMPKFSENSNEEEGEISGSNDDEPGTFEELIPQKSNFDLRKEEYEFKGTERSSRFTNIDDKSLDNAAILEEQVSVNKCGVDRSTVYGPSNEPPRASLSPVVSTKYDENSSHSERSLRICEDSIVDQRVVDTSNHLENCDSVKTPLNDEHSTESAPDVEKMDGLQVEVVTLAAVQQRIGTEKRSNRPRDCTRDSDRDHKLSSSASQHHRSSFSRDKKYHSSSKDSGSRRKSNHPCRKSENGNSSSNSGNTRRGHARKKHDDDHYSSHEKPVIKRRSTDRDSNDGSEHVKSLPFTGLNSTSGASANGSSKTYGSQKRSSDSQDEKVAKLNDTLESSFEGFDEDLMICDIKHAPKPLLKTSRTTSNGVHKCPKKVKKHKSPKDTIRKNDITNMDVFAFSFDKPAKLGKNGENVLEEEELLSTITDDSAFGDQGAVLRTENLGSLSTSESLIQIGKDVIILEPTEMEKVINAETYNIVDHKRPLLQNFPSTDPTDLVILATQPVVVDQMLTNGDNMDLELLIGEKELHGDESTMGKIQQGLNVIKNKMRKPKIANNFDEARKLMKIRRQMEREEKKTREQAMVLAKKLITVNGIANEDDQGIELEFVCDGGRNNSAPIISSPAQQNVSSHSSSDEKDLLYFPEQNEVFHINEMYFDWIRHKTNVSFPDDYAVKTWNVILYSLKPSCLDQKENSKLIPEDKPKEDSSINIMANVQGSLIQKEYVPKYSEKSKIEIPAELQTVRVMEISKDHQVQLQLEAMVELSPTNRRKRKRSGLPPVFNQIKRSDKEDPISAEGNHSNASDLMEQHIQNLHTGKARRIGLSRPKTNAEFTLVISDAKSAGVEDTSTSNNNNNGIIKPQRYDSYDLYKSANDLRTRTRARPDEILHAELKM
ncbi:uncharacterized protein LOC131677890 [Topomyia yanbarensis]|uniref:uncharacterized protein LOC131677890 n=1 Tax=Topomyia yanbarensis TaxID=2498891 RepID=UPI00273CCA49|nr:uncharacterized protein LOC131677890 [Topomyia yanbarensis]XP_058813965.1 uncharacterized protein LOC131677890 [Topomyia yanbarensis]